MAELRTAHGMVHLEGRRLRAVGPHDGAARAGDGLAAALGYAATTGDLGGLRVSVGQLRAVPRGAGREGSGPDATEHAIPVDQTHLSVVIEPSGGDPVVVKIVSEWGAADRAARLLDLLASAGSTDVPTFRGHLDWTHPELGRSTIALVSDLLPDSTDGWTWAVEDVLSHVRGGAPVPAWPAAVGALTARLHVALASGAEPAPPGAGRRWRERAAAALDAAVATTTGPAGLRLANRADAMHAVIAAMPDDTPAPVFAGHGDLHVGQLLRVGTTYRVLDFDGDPQLPAGERDRPEPAARDLAHLLVSLEQVACVAQRRAGGPDPAYPAWARVAGAELQEAYVAALGERGRADLLDPALLAGLQVEQLARELLYAARFLPRWTYAGDGAVVARFAAPPGTEEPPWTPPPFEPT